MGDESYGFLQARILAIMILLAGCSSINNMSSGGGVMLR